MSHIKRGVSIAQMEDNSYLVAFSNNCDTDKSIIKPFVDIDTAVYAARLFILGNSVMNEEQARNCMIADED